MNHHCGLFPGNCSPKQHKQLALHQATNVMSVGGPVMRKQQCRDVHRHSSGQLTGCLRTTTVRRILTGVQSWLLVWSQDDSESVCVAVSGSG